MSDPASVGFLDAELAAQRIIRDGRIRAPADINVDAIAMQLGVLVHDAQLEGCEARLLRRGQAGIVRVRSGIRELGRRRFAVAHELGHWIRHANHDQAHLCTQQDIDFHGNNIYSGSTMELEANVFAANLLMPTTMFRPKCEQMPPELKTIRGLSEEFKTTLTATIVRYVELTERDCMVVFSELGRVRWWRRSHSVPYLYMQANQSLDPRTGVVVYEEATYAGPFMADVEFDVWFPHIDRFHDGLVREETIYLNAYKKSISILWLD